MKSWIHGCWLSIVMGMAIVHSESQELFKAKDLTGFTADKLSEEELITYRQQLQELGISEATAAQLAIRKGLTSSPLTKLRASLAWAENQKTKKQKSCSDWFIGGKYQDSIISGILIALIRL